MDFIYPHFLPYIIDKFQECGSSVPRTPACLKNAREGSLAVNGVGLFNTFPISLRNSDRGDTAMFKNHLDIYLGNIPDQPTLSGLVRQQPSS